MCENCKDYKKIVKITKKLEINTLPDEKICYNICNHNNSMKPYDV